MEITETRISLINKPNSRLRAYASVTFDNSFVIREIRIIEGKNGLFIAMPSRKMQKSCAKCGFKSPVTSKFCGQCGEKMESVKEEDAGQQHKDLAHPINTQFREYLQKKILEAYQQQKSGTPAEN
jgi:stage V sporulation protein G